MGDGSWEFSFFMLEILEFIGFWNLIFGIYLSLTIFAKNFSNVKENEHDRKSTGRSFSRRSCWGKQRNCVTSTMM
jgi:hypothetical protein